MTSEGQPCREASEDPLRQTAGSMGVCCGGGAESGVMGRAGSWRAEEGGVGVAASGGQTNRRPPKLHKGILSAVGSWRIRFVLGLATVWERAGDGGACKRGSSKHQHFPTSASPHLLLRVAWPLCPGYPGSLEPSGPAPGPALGSQANQNPPFPLDETRASSLPGVTFFLWGSRGLDPVAKLQRVRGGWGARVTSCSACRTRPLHDRKAGYEVPL